MLTILFFFCHSDRCVLICHCTFNPPMVNDFEHLFLCLSAICISSSMKCLCISFICFLIGFCLYCWVLTVCYVLQIVVLCWIHGCKYYLLLCNVYFCPLSRVFFCRAKVFKLLKFSLSIFPFMELCSPPRIIID